MKPLIEWIDKVSPTAKYTYPTSWATERHVYRSIFQTFLAVSFVDEFASLFKDMDKKELDEMAHSFHYDKCVQREGLNKILKSHAVISGEGLPVPKYAAGSEELDLEQGQ